MGHRLSHRHTDGWTDKAFFRVFSISVSIVIIGSIIDSYRMAFWSASLFITAPSLCCHCWCRCLRCCQNYCRFCYFLIFVVMRLSFITSSLSFYRRRLSLSFYRHCYCCIDVIVVFLLSSSSSYFCCVFVVVVVLLTSLFYHRRYRFIVIVVILSLTLLLSSYHHRLIVV